MTGSTGGRGRDDDPNRRRVGCQHEVGQQREHDALPQRPILAPPRIQQDAHPTVKMVNPIQPKAISHGIRIPNPSVAA